jgi:hypothetical protein
MYLPNPDVHPTGYEPGEFIDVPAARTSRATGLSPRLAPAPNGETSPPRISSRTRSDITPWAEEYISGLVDNHPGAHEDVRTVIHDLHDRTAVSNANRRAPL